jgi:acetamidase/formamidase
MKYLGIVVLPMIAVNLCLAQSEVKTLSATPSTVVWGYYAANAKPILTVHSGDTVHMQTVSSCGPPAELIKAGLKDSDIPTYYKDIYEQVKDKGPGGHILTGPVAIQEAEPGDVLEVQILSIDIDTPYACNVFGPKSGFIPEDFQYSRYRVIPLDRKRMVAQFSPEVEIPLHPFFGSMGIAPPPSAGRIDSAPPGIHAGNMDNKELVAGTTLFIPVHAKGALFEAGDGHAGQGNGEVDITALETFLSGTFKFVVHKGQHLDWPMAETPTSYILMGFSPNLVEATKMSVRNTINFLVNEKGLSRDDAYMLASTAVDFDITELVDGNVGVHAIVPKKIFINETQN